MARTLWYLFETIGSLLASACILRAAAWHARLSARNPLVQFVIALTDWIVKPLRRMLPTARGTDWASLMAATLVAVLMAVVLALLNSHGRVPIFGAVILRAVFWLAQWSLYLLMGLVILQAVLSWVNPAAPLAPAVDQLTRPFLAPIRRFVPLVGGVDLSPLLLILIVQVLMMLLETALPMLLALG